MAAQHVHKTIHVGESYNLNSFKKLNCLCACVSAR